MSEADIEGFDSAAALKSAANLLAKRTTKSSDDARSDDSPATDESGDKVIDWDYLDPDTADALKKIMAKSEQTIKSLRDEVDRLKGEFAEQSNAARDQRFDAYVSDLDKPYQKLFDASGRRKVREEMDVLREGYRSRNRTVPDERALFDKAVNAVFADDFRKIDADRVKRSVRSRQK